MRCRHEAGSLLNAQPASAEPGRARPLHPQPIKGAILNRFGKMLGPQCVRISQIGNRVGHLEDFVVRAGGEMERGKCTACHGRRQPHLLEFVVDAV